MEQADILSDRRQESPVIRIPHDRLSDLHHYLEAPVLILSTTVGKGNVSVGNAIAKAISDHVKTMHYPIEEFLPEEAVVEDLVRYKFISNHIPFLLKIIYKFSPIYRRKLLRERFLKTTRLNRLREKVESVGARTVIGVSHRPTFWLSVLKERDRADFKLWGVLTEFGETLAWRYIFWEAVDAYVAPLPKSALSYAFSPQLRYFETDPICQPVFRALAGKKGDVNKTLFVFGYWGQVRPSKAAELLDKLLRSLPALHAIVVCGSNERLRKRLHAEFGSEPRVVLYGQMNSIAELLKQCASIVSKPGFSTLVEAHAAKRKIFLIKGMPVAEDHNALYAVRHFDAQWFTVKAFEQWYDNQIATELTR